MRREMGPYGPRRHIVLAGLVGFILAALMSIASLKTDLYGFTPEQRAIFGVSASIIIGAMLSPLYSRAHGGGKPSGGAVIEAIVAQTLVFLALWAGIYDFLNPFLNSIP